MCLPALIAACHSQASDRSAVWPLSYVCADRKKKFNLEGFYRDAVFPDVYLFVSQTMNKLREARNSSDYFWAFYVAFKFQIQAKPHS